MCRTICDSPDQRKSGRPLHVRLTQCYCSSALLEHTNWNLSPRQINLEMNGTNLVHPVGIPVLEQKKRIIVTDAGE